MSILKQIFLILNYMFEIKILIFYLTIGLLRFKI